RVPRPPNPLAGSAGRGLGEGMRVAIVQEFLDRARGGAETSVLEMARHLADLGQDVTILSRDRPEAAPLNVIRVPVHSLTRVGNTAEFVAGVDELRANFDVLHAVTPCRTASIYQPRGGTYGETIRRSVALAHSPMGRAITRLGRRFNARQRMLARIEAELL